MGPEALTLLYVPRLHIQQLFELQCLAAEAATSGSKKKAVAPACATEAKEDQEWEPTQLLEGAFVLAKIFDGYRLRRIVRVSKAPQSKEQAELTGPRCQVHVQGGQVMGLEQCSAEPLEEMSNDEIYAILCQYAHFAETLGVEPLERTSVLCTLQHL